MIHPNVLYLQRRRRVRLVTIGCVAVGVLFAVTSLLSGSREDFLNKASLTVLQGYVKQNPGDNDAAYRLAFRLVDDGNDAQAHAILERLVREHPNVAIYRYGLGRIKQAEGYVSESYPDLKTSISLDPQLSKAYLGIASISSSAGLYTEAIPAYKQAEQQGMDISDDILGWARAQNGVGNYQASWDRLIQQFEKTPAADSLYPLAAEAGMKLKKYSELETLLMRRLKMTSMYAVLPVRGALLRVLLIQHPSPIMLEAAERLAKDGFTIQGVDPDFLEINAEVLLARSKRAEAIKSLQQGLKMDPNHIGCLDLMARLKQESGLKAEADALTEKIERLKHITPEVTRCQKLVSAQPSDADAHKSLGDALMAAGNAAAANEEYHKAQSLAPANPAIPQCLEQSRAVALRQADKPVTNGRGPNSAVAL